MVIVVVVLCNGNCSCICSCSWSCIRGCSCSSCSWNVFEVEGVVVGSCSCSCIVVWCSEEVVYPSVYLQAWKRSYSARLPVFWTWQHPKRSISARLPQAFKLMTSKTKQLCATSFNNGKLSAVLRFFHSICLKYCACHAKDILPDRLQMSHSGHRFRTCYKGLMFCLLLARCIIPCRAATQNDTWTSKSAPNPLVLYTFDFEMCSAPQRRALFLTSQLPKVARAWCVLCILTSNCATTACTFSTSQLPKVVRHWGVLRILTSKCASRHNGVHFFDISTSKSGPGVRCF